MINAPVLHVIRLRHSARDEMTSLWEVSVLLKVLDDGDVVGAGGGPAGGAPFLEVLEFVLE